MRILIKFLLTAVLGGLSLVLVACGGGGGSSSGGGGGTTPTSVKLSGVVATGAVIASTNPTGVAMVAGATSTDANCTNLASTGTALANAIVIAVDKDGNTYTTSAGSDGSFTMSAPSGVNYALVFIDPHTLKVIGSLVQATNGSAVGAISLSTDTSMGRIVINGTTGQAFAQNDACGTTPTTDGSTTFQNSGGTISSDDITSMQSTTVANSGTTSLSNISVVNFMGDPDTWHISVQGGTGQNWGSQQTDCTSSGILYDITADYLESDFTVERAVTVPGPDGTNVTATKEASLGYYMKVSNLSSSPAGGDFTCWTSPNGYISDSVLSSNITNNNNGWMPPYANASTLDQDPVSAGLSGGTTGHAAFDWSYGLNGWGQYRYVDTADGKIVFGQKYLDSTTNTVKINWHTMALPLNFAPGTPATMQEDSNGDGTVDTTQTCTVSFATNTDSSAAIVTDTNGLKLPVVHVSCTNTPIAGTTGGRSGTESFYILAKYGAQVPDTDVVTGAALTWDQALHKYARFGTITRDPTTGAATGFVSTTPDTIGTTTGNSDLSAPMPDAALAGTATATLRDNWLQYVDDNADQLDVYIPNGTSMADYFWVKYDQTTGQAATPLSWDSTTQTVIPLTGGQATNFTVTELHYGISPSSGQAANLAFECQFRGWKSDPTAANGGTLVDIGTAVTATDANNTALTALAATTNEVVDSGVICPNLTVPTVTQINTATGTTGWQDWDSATQTSYNANSAELDLELVDTSTNTVIQSQSVNYYTVHN